jgi:hypothetical protein
MQRKRRGHRTPPLKWWPRLKLTPSAARATPRSLPFSIAVMNYFQSHIRLKITRAFIYHARPGRSLSPPDRPGQPVKQQNRENRTMTMISEKAIALLLAVALSGTAFNTFIV